MTFVTCKITSQIVKHHMCNSCHWHTPQGAGLLIKVCLNDKSRQSPSQTDFGLNEHRILKRNQMAGHSDYQAVECFSFVDDQHCPKS